MSHDGGYQFTIKRIMGRPVLMVRHAVPAEFPGEYTWTRWRPAPPDAEKAALQKLRELNK